MGIIDTKKWLVHYMKGSKREHRHPVLVQRQEVCQPLATYFDTNRVDELQHYLWHQGLFYPSSVHSVEESIGRMIESKVWEWVKAEYDDLKRMWNGVETNIFILPVETRHQMINRELGGKAGVAFCDKLILFLSPDVTQRKIAELLTHEYHHVCRLSILDKESDQLTLLDSLVIEGLAEAAVGERFGESALAPWTNMYRRKDVQRIWEALILPFLRVEGKKNHTPYLYGDPSRQLPKWIGYYLGFQLVHSVLEAHQQHHTKTLMRLSSEEIFRLSKWNEK